MIFFSFSTHPEFMEALRLSMNYGYIKYTDIIRWADDLIDRGEIPRQIVLDISLCPDAREMDLVLNNFVGTTKPVYSARILLSFIGQQVLNGELSEKDAAKKLYEISLSDLFLPEKDKQLCYPFDDEFYGIGRMWGGDMDKLKKEFRRFLSLFVNYRLDNVEEWQNIHPLVNNGLDNFDFGAWAPDRVVRKEEKQNVLEEEVIDTEPASPMRLVLILLRFVVVAIIINFVFHQLLALRGCIYK